MIIFPCFSYAVSNSTFIFLLIEPGSKPGSMGQAYVAQVDDGFSGYWNPGAMAFNRKTQFALMHSNWLGDVHGLDDIYYEYLGCNRYFESLDGNIGFHLIFISYGQQEKTTFDGTSQGMFSSYELAASTTYAYQYSETLGLGATFKIIYSYLAPEGTGATEPGKGSALGFGFDLGLKKKSLFINKLDWGLTLQNFGPDVTYIDNAQKDPMPINIRTGFSYRALEHEYYSLTVNTDASKVLANHDNIFVRLFTGFDEGSVVRTREAIIFNAGAEFTYLNLLAFRAGYIYDKAGSIIGPSFGAGIQYLFRDRYKATFDFAMQQAGEMTDYNKTFSLGLEF